MRRQYVTGAHQRMGRSKRRICHVTLQKWNNNNNNKSNKKKQTHRRQESKDTVSKVGGERGKKKRKYSIIPLSVSPNSGGACQDRDGGNVPREGVPRSVGWRFRDLRLGWGRGVGR